tara:strand:+ start:812 stop:1945 length:1134 start_codon:yes stop_codon:yes gene_type:complete
MEKIIFRKFFYSFASFFLIISLSLSLIIWVIQSVNYLDFVSKDGHGFQVYFAFVSLNFPKIFSKVNIFSYFICLFYIIQKYKTNNEILIFWTNGVSKLKLVNFIIRVSILFTILQILLTYYIVPKTQDYSRDFIRNSNVDLFSSLITEKKFIDTVKDFTIYVENIDDKGNMKNVYIKDSIDISNIQIISARSGKIFESGPNKILYLSFGEIVDITDNNYKDSRVIKFNNTTINLSNVKTKSTTHPKLQELDSKILIDCVNNFMIGTKINYSLPFFVCDKYSSIKSTQEIFKRSFKQFYIIILGTVASLLIFSNNQNKKNFSYELLIFAIGFFIIIFSELNSEFLNISIRNNLFFVLLPFILFIIVYSTIFNLNNKSI